MNDLHLTKDRRRVDRQTTKTTVSAPSLESPAPIPSEEKPLVSASFGGRSHYLPTVLDRLISFVAELLRSLERWISGKLLRPEKQVIIQKPIPTEEEISTPSTAPSPLVKASLPAFDSSDGDEEEERLSKGK